jgi:hypothetical protein
MPLPAGGPHEFLGRGAARLFQQVQNVGGFAAIADSFFGLGWFRALGRSLGRGGLLAGLGFLRATLAGRAPDWPY